MNELTALHYYTGRPIRVVWDEERIVALEAAAKAPDHLWVAPPLVDLQINGYGGVDFQQDDLSREQLLHAALQLRADGCGRWLLTLITDVWPKLIDRLRHLRALRAASPRLRRTIAGWHIEGPFLSAKPGFHGAHDPALMIDPTPTHLRELRAVTGCDPVLLTLAPERAGALEAIRLAVDLGFKVSLGHTDAPLAILQAAFQAGAKGFTHLGNGCPRELDRHDNILWRMLELAHETEDVNQPISRNKPGRLISLIPDGHHVSPTPFALIHHCLPPESVYYTTDAMAAAGAGPGRFTLGRFEVEVGSDQIVRQPGQSNFAGSALRPIEGVFRAVQMLGCPWPVAWRRFSEVPTRWMGWEPSLEFGSPGPFCVLDFCNQSEVPSVKMLGPGLATA